MVSLCGVSITQCGVSITEMSTESEEVYYTPQSSFSEEPENVIPTNIAQESQYYTPSKRLISFGFQIDLFFTLFCMQE